MAELKQIITKRLDGQALAGWLPPCTHSAVVCCQIPPNTIPMTNGDTLDASLTTLAMSSFTGVVVCSSAGYDCVFDRKIVSSNSRAGRSVPLLGPCLLRAEKTGWCLFSESCYQKAVVLTGRSLVQIPELGDTTGSCLLCREKLLFSREQDHIRFHCSLGFPSQYWNSDHSLSVLLRNWYPYQAQVFFACVAVVI